ncbi:MAG: RNA pseudouridine synthase [Spirochaetales bacterium]|nr:RNA pseudouridine synthase [Spirochaetales bacterium]
MNVLPDKTGDPSLKDLLTGRLAAGISPAPFLEPVHRLDRPASGIVLFAKTPAAAEQFGLLFRERKIKKIYWAITVDSPPKQTDTLIHFIDTNKSKNKSYVAESTGKKAELNYTVIGKSDRYTFLEIRLVTGRHHQIRTQLAAIGAMIKGDIKYGARRKNHDRSIHLHARLLEFCHPSTGTIVKITAAPPKDVLWQLMEKTILHA